MTNTTQKSFSAAVAGIMPVAVARVVEEGAVVKREEIEIPSKALALGGRVIEGVVVVEENGMGADGEVKPVAVVTEEEAGAMSLEPEQCVAIMQLTSGRTRSEAARAAGVSRMTLYRWLNHDPRFMAAYNTWERDMFSTTRGQMVATMPDAMRTVIKAIRDGDARLAWKLLESQGVTGKVTPGPTDVEEVKRGQVMEKKRKEVEEKMERAKMAQDEMLSQFG